MTNTQKVSVVEWLSISACRAEDRGFIPHRDVLVEVVYVIQYHTLL